MRYDPNALVERWSGAARRGTLANIGWSLAFLSVVAIVLRVVI